MGNIDTLGFQRCHCLSGFDPNNHCLTKVYCTKRVKLCFNGGSITKILFGGSNLSQKYACQLGNQPQACLKTANVGNYPVDDITLAGAQVWNVLRVHYYLYAILQYYRFIDNVDAIRIENERQHACILFCCDVNHRRLFRRDLNVQK